MDFLCTFVYGHSESRSARQPLWTELKSYGGRLTEPWMVLGDFNSILSADEREGESVPGLYVMRELQDVCTRCGLRDSPSIGDLLTWHSAKWKIRRKLDRVLLNQGWDNNACRATYIPISSHSDHAPVVVSMMQENDTRNRPFRFQNMWLHHPSFQQTVEDYWAPDYTGYKQYAVCRKLKELKMPLKDLGVKDFNHISEKAKRQTRSIVRPIVRLQ